MHQLVNKNTLIAVCSSLIHSCRYLIFCQELKLDLSHSENSRDGKVSNRGRKSTLFVLTPLCGEWSTLLSDAVLCGKEPKLPVG